MKPKIEIINLKFLFKMKPYKIEILSIILFFIKIKYVHSTENNHSYDLNERMRPQVRADTSCGYGFVFQNKEGCSICGNFTFNQNARIVGGLQAIPYSWPAHVYITENISFKIRVGDTGAFENISLSYICGGTIINRYTILGAAHCISESFKMSIDNKPCTPKIPDDAIIEYSVYVGAYNISFINRNESPKLPTIKMAVRKVLRHPDYNKTNLLNDIGLYFLKEQIEFNEYIQPACLPNRITKFYPPINSILFASGWGDLQYEGYSPDVLYNVRLTNNDFEICRKLYLNVKEDSQICAGDLYNGKDTCQGDSGGGLYAYDSILNKYILSGIVSYGKGCGFGAPAIYTRVSFYHDWIDSTIKRESKNLINSSFIKNLSILFTLTFNSFFYCFYFFKV